MKDHEIRELVNQLRDVAIKYHGTGQLREQIARTVRAAILQVQSDDDGEPTDDERIMAIEGIHNCERCGDEGWVVGEMGITRCACGQAGNSPVITDGSAVAALTGIPMIPDGYVMVPKDLLSELRDWAHPEIEKYCEMWEGRRDSEFPALRKVITDADALLAAEPQSPGSEPATVPGKWIPVSDRLPFDEIVSLPKPMGAPFLVAYSSGAVDISWYSCRQDITGRRGEWDGETGTLAIAMGRGKITHWMPLPAAPQEVNHG
ncbi:DUF551 domain-containing protein [Klebsiella pneumoniae]